MTNNPKISVVMPAFNASKYIAEAIQSIQAQSFADWELVIVDDYSSDNTVELVKAMQADDARIVLIERSENSGGCRIPRLEAVQAARGEWICDVDSDDTIAPDVFEKLLQRQEQTGADMVLGRITICDANLNPGTTTLPKMDFAMEQICKGLDVVKYTLNGWKISLTGGITHSSIWRKHLSGTDMGGFNGGFSDEIDRRKILVLAHTVAWTDAAYYYRQIPTSIVHNLSAKSFGSIRNSINLLNFIREIDAEGKLQQTMHDEYIETIYRYAIKYQLHKHTFTADERTHIRTLLREAYRHVGTNKMRFQAPKHQALATNYTLFTLITLLAAGYTKFKQ